MALTALGIDPTADSRFVKNGVTVAGRAVPASMSPAAASSTPDGRRRVDGMATEQGYYALAAYYRLVNCRQDPACTT